MYTNGDCTVFNRIYDPITRLDTWMATHLYGIFWENTKGANVIKSGMKDADGVRVFIPFAVGCDKAYCSPLAFKENPTTNVFTLRPEDKLVYGIVDHVGSIAGLADVFDCVATITAVDTMNYGSADMQHWEVSGR